MKNWIKKHYEALWLRIAIKILEGRNVARSPVVSRKDNNHMYSMAEQLEGVRRRIIDEYNNI